MASYSLRKEILKLQSECCLQDSNLSIFSIAGSDENGHVFVVDGRDESIKEFAESGEIVGQYPFGDGIVRFSPRDICRLTKDILVVCGPFQSERGSGWRGGILFLARKKSPPFLEKVNLIDTDENEFYSLCKMDEKIFVCDLYFEEILCFSKKGEKIKTIQLEKSPGSGSDSAPLLRADPKTGNLWGTRRGLSEIFVFDPNGRILQTVETEQEITDFRGNGFGQFYFSNKEGIFSVLPEKVLYKFPKESENIPRIFVLKKILFVCFQYDGKILMKSFKINKKKKLCCV